ncbi:HNH endonuclease [Xinfangfangia sp. D13-10-4-6]|uniref:HNH endonuclease n=1 Tax=Pseudogemmobacter hezensis TaxID=2737662 RepID=UPI0015569269|nr:HNH endonuclease [Pseudogemmobacter hezensis]NPD14470.1 HNH endonuclease [Pseudogemmobacter hezensis]
MPSKPPRICRCGHRVAPKILCPCEAKRAAERKARFDKGRPSATQRGLGADWRKVRDAHLERHPRCRICGEDEGSLEVDHIKPRRVAPERRLDPTNLQTLCKPCHSRLKQREERRNTQR